MTLQIYLDTSVYNRPFDNQKQARIWLETLAFSAILQMIEQGDVKLVQSSVVEFETSRNPNKMHQKQVQQILKLADRCVLVDEKIQHRANELNLSNITPLDALHIAVAESVECDYFVTCDDRLIRRYNKNYVSQLIVCNPTEFIRMTTGA